MKYLKNKKYFILILISVLLFFVATVSTVVFMLNQIFLNKQHEIKWRDYDDCGIV